MVRAFIVLCSLVFISSLFAQEDTVKFRYQSMLKGTATISPGSSNDPHVGPRTNIYINGDLEYFPEENASLRGEIFWMVGTQQKPALLKDNSTLLFGGLYHTHVNRLDLFIGLQPGVSLTKPADLTFNYLIISGSSTVNTTETISFNYKVLPVISPIIGVTFYASDYFNFFLNMRYVKEKYFGYYAGQSLLLDEFRLSAGLGFQIHLKKKK